MRQYIYLLALGRELLEGAGARLEAAGQKLHLVQSLKDAVEALECLVELSQVSGSLLSSTLSDSRATRHVRANGETKQIFENAQWELPSRPSAA